MTTSNLEKGKLTFLAVLTLVVVSVYVVAAAFALWQGGMDFKEFSAAVGPLAGMLLGYWVRGESAAPPS